MRFILCYKNDPNLTKLPLLYWHIFDLTAILPDRDSGLILQLKAQRPREVKNSPKVTQLQVSLPAHYPTHHMSSLHPFAGTWIPSVSQHLSLPQPVYHVLQYSWRQAAIHGNLARKKNQQTARRLAFLRQGGGSESAEKPGAQRVLRVTAW